MISDEDFDDADMVSADPFDFYLYLVGPPINPKKAGPMKPEQFAQILIEKLETVKRNQEAEEKFAHKLLESEDGCGPSAKTLADAIRERFGIDDDNDQDILDQHVSRVWSDLTPSRTPGLASPRPRSPDALRRSRSSQSTPKVCSVAPGTSMHGAQSLHHPYLTRPPHPSRYPRKDRDGFSTFSSDSGNVNDFSDDKMHLPKSKSVPDYAESTDTYSSMPSHEGRFRTSREWSGNRRHLSKKPELTDSGICDFLGRCAFEGNPLHSRGLISYSGMSEQPPKVVESKPGDGIRSMKTSNVFRAINFELYAAPNKVIMAMGLVAVIGCTGYIIYMREKYKGMGYYPAVDSEGKEHFIKKKSKWD